MRQCCILQHNTPEPALSKAPQAKLLPNVLHFATLDENNFKQFDCIASGMDPRTALTGKDITALDITILPIGTVLA